MASITRQYRMSMGYTPKLIYRKARISAVSALTPRQNSIYTHAVIH